MCMHSSQKVLYLSPCRYAFSSSGHVLLISYPTVAMLKMWHLLLEQSVGVAIVSMAIHSSFVATGSEDGFLRIWSPDFSTVTMETGIQCTH